MADKKLTKDQIESIARFAAEDAIDFIESHVQPARITCQRYYDGEVDIGEEEGRSKVVATKVRDTIHACMPSLMRVFLTTNRAVEYVPSSPQRAAEAETASRYANTLFRRKKGYGLLRGAILDACIKKVGIIKAYWDTYEETEELTYTNVTIEEANFLIEDPDVEVTDGEPDDEKGGFKRLVLQKTKTGGCLELEAVPPEEFFIDESATCVSDAYVCGQQTDRRVYDLVEMGFALEDVVDLGSLHNEDENDPERLERKQHDEAEVASEDPSMRWVTVTECYMRIDTEGNGIPQLHKVLLAGKEYKLLDYEPVQQAPYAAFMIMPQAHAFMGDSLAEYLLHDQDVATLMLRGMCDNVAMTNNPRLEVDDSVVNMDDLLNNEIGAVVRSQRVGTAINELTVPFTAGQTLSAMQYFDQQVEGKSGVYTASNGLHPDALQSSTATAVQATVQASAGQMEVFARNLAETGMVDLFTLILRLVVQNSNEEELMEIGGQMVPINPKVWDMEMGVSVNVGLGTGREEQRAAALNRALEIQMQVISTYGVDNPVTGLENARNTIADLLALNGIHDVDRYFPPPQPMAPQQPQQPQGDPNEAYVRAEAQKAQIKEQGATQRKQMELADKQQDRLLEAMRALRDDDFRRDELDQDLLVAAAEIIGKYGTSVDVEKIKAMQNAPRDPMPMMPGGMQ